MATKGRRRPGISLDLEGHRDLTFAFNALNNDEQRKTAAKGLEAAAGIIRDAAKRYVPADTGALRDSIRLEYKGARMQRNRLVATVRTGSREELGIDKDAKWYYPMVLEYGGLRGATSHQKNVIRSGWTNRKKGKNYFYVRKGVERWRTGGTRIPARPYIRPAVDNNRPAILKAMADGIRAAIAKVWGKKGMAATNYAGNGWVERDVGEAIGRFGTDQERMW